MSRSLLALLALLLRHRLWAAAPVTIALYVAAYVVLRGPIGMAWEWFRDVYGAVAGLVW
jgi:hypothetical protein